MMNAIKTKDARIVKKLLEAYANTGVGGINHGKYRYHIADIWDGDAWVTVVVRTPLATIRSGLFDASNTPFGSYHYKGSVVYAYL